MVTCGCAALGSRYDAKEMINRPEIAKQSVTMLLALGVAVLALFFFGWLAEEMLENETQHFDTVVREAVHTVASPAMTAFFRFMSNAAGPVALFCYSAATAGVLLWLGFRTSSALMAIMMVGGGALDVALKQGFHRARPVPYFGLTAPPNYSFPSGHSLMSLCFFGTAAYLISVHIESRQARIAVRVLAGILTLLVGLSRIYLGVHYPSDVVAGFAAGLVWLTAVIYAYQRITGNTR